MAAAAAAATPAFPSLAGGRRAVAAAAAAAAAGQGWAELRTPGPPIPARLRTPGPPIPARLQAPGPGRQGSCDPCAQRVASWGCARIPAPGIMGNGMTKVGGRDGATRTWPAPAPAGRPPLTFWLWRSVCLFLCLPGTLRSYVSVCLSGAVSLSDSASLCLCL